MSSVDEFYRYGDDDRVVDPERSLAARVEEIERALAAGFTGLRVVADATAVVGRPEQVDAFARYEYLLDQAMAYAEGGKCYQALRLARRVMQHEDAVLGRAPRPRANEAPLSREEG